MDPVVDERTVDRVMEMAGCLQHRHIDVPCVFASAAAFALGDEEMRLSILSPPDVPRGASGPARWLVVTDSRVIEVVGEMPGDWWSRSSLHQRVVSDIEVSITPLKCFRRFVFTGEGWIWHPDGPTSIGDFLRGTTALLEPQDRSENLVLWKDYVDSGSAYPKPAELLTALRWLATSVSPRHEEA